MTEVFATLARRENPVIQKLAVGWADVTEISSEVFTRAVVRLKEFRYESLYGTPLAPGQLHHLLRHLATSGGGEVGLRKLTIRGVDLVEIPAEVLVAAVERVGEVRLLDARMSQAQWRRVVETGTEMVFSGQVDQY